MTRWSCAAVMVCLMACSDGRPHQPLPDLCGGEQCEEGQRCDLPTLHCVTNEAPRLLLHGPLAVVREASFEVSGAVIDDTEGTRVEWHEEVGDWQPVTLAADGRFSITVPARELDAEPVLVTVRVSDGLVQFERSTLAIVDRVAPVLELRAPTAGTVIGGNSATVTVVAHDGSDRLETLTIAGQDVPSARPDAELSAVVTIPLGDRRDFAVLVAAQDGSGNRTEQLFMLQVDGVGPSLRFLAPNQQTAALRAPSFRVEVEATDATTVDRVRLAINDGGFVEAASQDGRLWAIDLPIPEVQAEATFSAQAIDAVGNVTSLRSAPVQIDRIAPTVEVLAPDLDAIVAQAFSVRVLAGPDAASVTATFAGTTIPLQRSPPDDHWTGEVPLTVQRDYSAEFVVAVVRDAAGNERSSTPHRLFIDTVAPTLTFLTPTANARLNQSHFAGSDEVTVSWQVQDADPQAALVSIDGVPSPPAHDTRITTLPSDDGRSITTTVVVSDRAQHQTTGSVTFSVDRVAPTIVAWLPAANARNVEPRTTGITFSERVLGPTTSSDALTLAPVVTQPGSWDAAHRTWTSADLAPYAVFTASLADLTDLAGNPLAQTSSRKFHTAAFVPASGTVLATGVRGFKVASDADGVATLSIATATKFTVQSLSPVSGTLGGPSVSLSRLITDFELNAWAVVDPLTLLASHRVGSSYRFGDELHRQAITDGVSAPISFVATGGAAGTVLSVPAFSAEADASAFAVTNAASYVRGAASAVMSHSPRLIAQSGYTWAGFSTSSTAVTWSRFLCIASFLGAPNCTSYAFSAPATNPTELRAVISPTARCLVASWDTGGARVAVFQPLTYCNEWRLAGTPLHASCQSNPGPSPVSVPGSLKVAPFSAQGENTLLAASLDNGLRLSKMTNPAACTSDFTALGTPSSDAVTAFEPVQLGNQPAVLYIDGSSNLKLFVP